MDYQLHEEADLGAVFAVVRQGLRDAAALPGFPAGHTHYHMSKTLDVESR